MKQRYQDKLIAIDIVSSVPYARIDFDYVDIAFFSVQKGFGLPAGLGVMIVSPRALEKSDFVFRKNKLSTYHSFSALVEKERLGQTPETPNVLNIYLLSKVSEDFLRQRIGKIRSDIELKAKSIYDFFDHHPDFHPFIKALEFRSPTTIVIDTKTRTAEVINKLKKKGLIVSSGYGKNKNNHIRIANFPAHQVKDVNNLLTNVFSSGKKREYHD